jgi:hypothetical protein
MTDMRRFYNDFVDVLVNNGKGIYFLNANFLISEFPDACSVCTLPYEDGHGRLIGVAVQADMLNPDYPGDYEPQCLNAGIKYFIPDHNRKVMVEVRPGKRR